MRGRNMMKEETNKLDELIAKAQQREEIDGGERNIEEIISAIKILREIMEREGRELNEGNIEQIRKIKDSILLVLQKRKDPDVLEEALQTINEGATTIKEISNEKEIDEIKIAVARIIKQGDERNRKMAVKTFIAYIRDDLTANNKDTKIKALTKINWLGEIEPEQIGEVLEIIFKLLNDESWVIREETMKIIGIVRKGTEKEVDILIKKLSDEKKEVQFRAAIILGELAKEGNKFIKKAIRPLEEGLEKTKDKDIRFWYAFALAQIEQTKKGIGYKELVKMDEEGILTGSWETKFKQLYYKTPKEKLKEEFEEVINLTDEKKKGKALEEFCEQFFKQIEEFVVKRNKKYGDQEIDLEIENRINNDEFWSKIKSPIIYIECKNQKEKISTKEIGWLTKKMEYQPLLVKLGFFIALNGFSKECLTTLSYERNKERTIGLIEKKDFEDYFRGENNALRFLEDIIKRTMNYKG